MYKKIIKRLLDILLSVLILPFFLVLLIIIAPIIYLEDKGKVFYNGKRLGKNGKIFKMYKFRTMKENSEDIRNKDGSTYNSENDTRVTKIGKFLRKTSLDEVPQIINVLKGDMSFIGPRPDLPEHMKLYSEFEKRKLEIRPGITGYNQAYYRNSIEWKERIKNDIYYIDNLSIWMDIKVFFKTFITVFRKEGVYINKIDKKYEIKELEWDTEFFGVKSAKVVLKEEINKNDIDEIVSIANKENYKFITINNLNNNNTNNFYLQYIKNMFLTDVNIQLVKKVEEPHEEADKHIIIKNNMEYNKEILEISKESFVYSRFYNDKKLKNSEDIYLKWAENAFNKTDKYYCVYKNAEEIAGYTLFSVEDEILIIELIAVNKNIQEKGIGSKLINVLNKYAYENNLKEIHVGTQINNINAQNFYVKNGFKHSTNNTIYHWWNE